MLSRLRSPMSAPKTAAFLLAACWAAAAAAQEDARVRPNYQQAAQYSSQYLRQFLYDTSVTPRWIGKTDQFWYSYRTSAGIQYYRVNPALGTKTPLFDRVKLAALLTEKVQKPFDPLLLSLSRLAMNDEGTKLKFVIDDFEYEYDLNAETLAKLGRAAAQQGTRPPEGIRTREDFERWRDEMLRRREEERRDNDQDQQRRDQDNQRRDQDQQQDQQDQNDQQREQGDQRGTQQEGQQEVQQRTGQQGQSQQGQQTQQGQGRGGPGSGVRRPDHRSFSPDNQGYVFAKGHNLYYVEVPQEKKEEPKQEPDKKEEPKKDEAKKDDSQQDEGKSDEKKEDGKQAGDKKQESEKKADEKKADDKKANEAKADDAKKAEENKQSEEAKTDEAKKSDEEKKADELKQSEEAKKSDEAAKASDAKAAQEGKSEEKKTGEKTGEKTGDEKKADEKNADEKADAGKPDETKPQTSSSSRPASSSAIDRDDQAIQLTTDGAEDYSFAGSSISAFGGRGGRGGSGSSSSQASAITPDRKTRPNVTWSKDSRSFYIARTDSRNLQELWVINSLAQPRPTLEKYKYPMPGEENIRKTELYYFHRDKKKLTRVPVKWKDESYSNVQWDKTGDVLRFLRRDRLLRHVELCALNVVTGECKCLISEGFENAYHVPPTMRALDDTDEFIWWSERSGWGHFYLYDRNGTLKNAITSGPYRASRIVEIDAKNRMMYFLGNAREPDENLYYEHLYCVHLDGSGLQLLDPGPASHRSVLSPSKRYLVDNCSRVDAAPCSVLREASGRKIMDLETADLSRLNEVGWRLPETFIVKAADGVTDLYGNMWKPFDFDPNKKYPIIAHVYPGPQTEGTTHTFSATSGEQQLAQLGFIVIQVGHRGGAPTRSKAYASYGYFNLRDYGLADKKAAIEQLAARHKYVDISRVGLYGHSGGGFMTAAAMLQKPYNEFFKVGVATAGNHDNNVYNHSWAERYHGLKEVDVKEETATQTGGSRGQGFRGFGGSGQGGGQGSGQGSGRGEQSRGAGERSARDEFSVDASDYFYEAEDLDDDSHSEEYWEQLAREFEAMLFAEADEPQQRGGNGQSEGQRSNQTTGGQSGTQSQNQNQGNNQSQQSQQGTREKKTRFEISVPTNAELAPNLKGKLLLIHGEADNNVHPANTLRLVDALMKANKRFDMLYLPATRHSFGNYQPYVTQRMYEYFAEHLLGDYQPGADIMEKAPIRHDLR